MSDSTVAPGTPVTPAPVGQAADGTSPNGNGHSEVVADSGSITLSFTDPSAVLSYAGNGDYGLTTGYFQSGTAGRGVIRITTNQSFNYNGTGSTLVSLAAASGADTLFIAGRSVTMTTGTLTALGTNSTALDVTAHGGAGFGAMDVTIDGDISSAAGGAITLDQNDGAATGNVRLSSTAGNTVTAGAGNAISIITSGAGTISVALADLVSASNGDGIVVRDSAGGGNISVTTREVSALSEGRDAIDVQSASSRADVTIVADGPLSAGDDGVVATITDAAASGNISVTTRGRVDAGNNGIDAINSGNGGIRIHALGAVSSADDGITAISSGGAIAITADSSVVSSAEEGIDATQNDSTGAGAIDVVTGGDVSGFVRGIRIQNAGTGSVTLAVGGSVTGTNGDAILIISDHAGGAISVSTAQGETLSASQGSGIDINRAGTGDVNVTNAAAINSGALANTFNHGIDVHATGTGNINISNNGAVGSAGDRAQLTGLNGTIINPSSAGAVSIAGSGSIFSVGDGINIETTGTGAAAVNYSGTIDTSAGDGIDVQTTRGSITVVSGAISAAGGDGIETLSTTGDQTITVNGSVFGGAFDGVRADSGSGTITVHVNGGNVTAADDAVSVASSGTKTVNVAEGRILSGGDLGVASTGSGATAINNRGTIEGTGMAIRSNTSVTTINNLAGATVNGAISLSAFNDTLNNAGTISGGVDLGAGDDLYNGSSGSVGGTVSGNDGNDTMLGGAGIDRLSGGAGSDLLEGNGGADILTGGAEADTFRGDAAGLNGDRITDFSTGDKIVIRDADMASFTYSLSGNTLTFTGGSLTLSGFSGQLQASAAAGGGVQLTVVGTAVPDAPNDFNGDGRSDLAWRRDDGSFMTWHGQPNGSLVLNPGSAPNAIGTDWRIVGLGDFNGDHRDDILWRHSSGEIGEWLGQAGGAFINNGGAAANAVDNSWATVGIADYNGDGRDDILWRHTSGEITQWLGQADGSFTNNSGAAANAVDNSWAVATSGDFNNDGRGDVLWRHSSGVYVEWQGSSTGALINAGQVMAGATGTVVGSADFNGDGHDDVLLRSATNGAITVWHGQAGGQFTAFTPGLQVLDNSWRIAAMGDYNGDGRDDLIWRHSSGAGAEWLGLADGGFAHNGAISTVSPDWTIQSPDIFLV